MLTGRKRRLLHEDILEYLRLAGFDATATQFAEEMEGVTVEVTEACNLERKYANVLRTAKQLSQAEEQVKLLEKSLEELKDPTKVKQALSTRDYLPSRVLHTMAGHGTRKEVCSLVFHPVQSVLYSGGEDGKIKVWDYETGTSLGTIVGHNGPVKGLAIESQGNRLASCSEDCEVRVYDTATEALSRRLTGHEHTVSSVEFVAPDDRLLATASRDGSVRLWDIQNSCVEAVFRTPDSTWVRCVRVIGSKVVHVGDNHLVSMWDTNTKGERLVGGHDHVIEVLAAANSKAREILFEYEKLRARAEVDANDETTNSAIDGPPDYVATGGRDKIIKIWNLRNCSEVMELQGHKDWVRDLVFHLNGKYLLSSSDDGTVKVWCLEDRRCLRTVMAHEHAFVSSLAYHPAGRFLVTGSSSDQIKVFKCE
eukprot:TRINITY_DN4208_c5_g1_i1.p1 TRINITY_DN4208_c5_g1~~TRINITY_DN4208_c5_g1_i1.p1  ORF type:complete len:423 (+),score=129.51 TRINITY_DN4208_c5_g1_i1:122-1390(+)